MNFRACAFGLLLAASPAFAHDVDGKWTGSIDTPNGPVTINYVFKADGKKLTGTTTGPDGNTIKIMDGKVDGNNIAFSLTLSFGPDPTTFNYTGVVASNAIKLHSEFMGQPIDFTLKKSN